jgi:hypothetical protein
MNPYLIVVFVHVVGVMGMFAGLTLDWTTLASLRRAHTAEQARDALDSFAIVPRVGIPALLVTLGAGIYLAFQWKWQAPWIHTGFASMLLLPILGGAITGRRLGALRRSLPERGSLPAAVLERTQDPLLALSFRVRLAIVTGIAFLMEVKPPLFEGLLAMGLAVIAGLAWSAPAWLRVRGVGPQGAA